MIRALTFDVGGTLADGELNRDSYRAELLEYMRSLGFGVHPTEFRKVMNSALRRLREIREKLREMKFEDFYSGILEALRVPAHREILEGIRLIYGRNFPQSLKPGTRETLEELRETYKLGVISNSMSGMPKDLLEREGLAGYFEVIVISREVGIRKPDPRIFSIALERLGVKPSEAVHVGNSLEEDVRGAKEAGMRTVLMGKEVGQAGVEPDLMVGSITELPAALRRLDRP